MEENLNNTMTNDDLKKQIKPFAFKAFVLSIIVIGLTFILSIINHFLWPYRYTNIAYAIVILIFVLAVLAVWITNLVFVVQIWRLGYDKDKENNIIYILVLIGSLVFMILCTVALGIFLFSKKEEKPKDNNMPNKMDNNQAS